ncbi:MAG: galactokinase [Candidatus Marinimicrobia bacterium]|nr:galactokinase [Candidatus Neomarinimicrobiota bacterium]
MIITRTPFRVTLGGGGTDLPSYYEKHGGFIFSFALDKYMFITVKRPFADHLIRLKYNISETVEKLSELKHDIARECLTKLNITNSIDVVSMADIPAGSGLGSSSSYTVGLLNALHTMKRDYIPLNDLAEEACEIEMYRLNKPMGKQDQYIATFGGFTVLEIAKDGGVNVKRANINDSTIEGLKRNLLSFYTGVQRKNVGILARQSQSTESNEKQVLESLHYIKESGYKILDMVESGNIAELGHMFDEHWKYKKRLAKGISNPYFDKIYETAKKNGALGGKITGAGGGGFFLFYCEENQDKLRKAMKDAGLKEMRFNFDYEGTKVLVNFMDYTLEGK